MINLIRHGVYLIDGLTIAAPTGPAGLAALSACLDSAGHYEAANAIASDQARKGTIAYQILSAHNTAADDRNLKLTFDCLTSHDITFVGIVQTARASGLKQFPVPYVLTNCHNSLCAVGGTINEDDHVFGLSAARKYGGIYVPAHQAVIHQYMREMMAGCGRMILGSDSHTRYGALGTLAIGEGGGELVKQLLSKTYDIAYPDVVAVYLEGCPQPGVGPQDVALAIIGTVFAEGFVKNKVLEFVGPGIAALSADFRNGIDVMTTETTCLSSIWQTDDTIRDYYAVHGRPEAYRQLTPGPVAYYDAMVKVDLSRIEPMIALPFHPSNVWTIAEFNRNPADILRQVEKDGQELLGNSRVQLNLTDKVIDGRLRVDQGIVAGCAGGTFENIAAVAHLLAGSSTGSGAFALSVYPASQPVNLELVRNGAMADLMQAGAIIRTAFCGPCFGAGDVPAHNGLSIRHTTRNFPNREGSKPVEGQIASVALMDARSIAATARRGGILTAATEVDFSDTAVPYRFDPDCYRNRVYQGFGRPEAETELALGPNIADWPAIRPLPQNLLLQVAAVLRDAVTTTDELIPSGETSSFRSNPLRLAEFTLSRKEPHYVPRAKAVQELEHSRQAGQITDAVKAFFQPVIADTLPEAETGRLFANTGIGSVIFAVKPGDGSAREQAASCQRVLGGDANIAIDYATKRYRSNLINWGMIPFTVDTVHKDAFTTGDLIYIPAVRAAVAGGAERVKAYLINAAGHRPLELQLNNLSQEDREIILAGCLINYYQ
ncbi:MAG: hydratase [Sporomusaceae bacterium]|nr:hydratase [Sporomusaceae bacterium]